MNDDLRNRILSESGRFGLGVRCSRNGVDVYLQTHRGDPSIAAQFPLWAFLQQTDEMLSTPQSQDCLESFRRLYEVFENSCASRVEGNAGSAKVCLYQASDGMHIKYRI